MPSHQPIFVEPFDWAVIRLASLQCEKNKPGRLLFATVTLLTPERPPPTKLMPKKPLDKQPLKNKGGTVFFRSVLLKASEAVEWYRSLNNESSKTPLPSLVNHQNKKLDNIELKTPDLIDDPLWPELGLPLKGWLSSNIFDETNPCPFLGTVFSRVHRRFGNDSGFELFLDDAQALTFIERRLHIDLKDYPEYLGSAVLVVPSPIIQKINNFMIPATETTGERIFHHITPYPNQTLDSLKITFFDKQAGLLSNFTTIDVPEDGIIDIDKGRCTGQYGYAITHPQHGILYYSAPKGFLREMHFQSHIVTEHREVIAPESDSPKAANTRYTVSRSHPMSKRVIGKTSIQNVNARVGQAVRNREILVEAKRYHQYWFEPGQREIAAKLLRELIGKAQKKLLIADPYFGALQVPQFLYAVRMSQVKITVLTSRLAFETSKEICDETKQSTQTLKQKLAMLDHSVVQLKELGNPDCEVLVMTGKPPKLHDRFLCIDDNIWLIGSSLNAIGDRAAIMMKLPDPKPVSTSLQDILANAVPYKIQYREYYPEVKPEGDDDDPQT
ncbi:VPA1262 family N-terminal domain-containing protein [Thiothrix nivea]|uniref:Phospholipase D-like domain-containing protein n=1 Tax=Thiothrix nivea (strain ATCC 35100 / DSM 5205 / JP2) TaxID=870187 RepID=A0A656HCA8_THINJ|nr:VPA1262 family N-terminal domain-containing protein [Thiothrix nivea]EIJ34791.1 hypothetical protein Thini_2228 [Thiothrix nivea DSM 5205]